MAGDMIQKVAKYGMTRLDGENISYTFRFTTGYVRLQ